STVLTISNCSGYNCCSTSSRKEDRKELFGRDKEIDYAISQLLSKKAVCKILYSKEEQIDVRSKPQL
ncbi:MAG: hypothetical protein L7H01_08255, partial [Sulfolobales archaeon]|nr:hypothetical protein [Sulfolobales archaeon]